MNRLLSEQYLATANAIKADIQRCRRLVLGMDCWSKKGLSGSYLAISASFFNPQTHRPCHVLLNLHQIAHPHTGDMLAEKIAATPHEWSIPLSKILTVVTDNGSNMIKAIKCVKTAATALMQTTGSGEAENSEAESGSETDSDMDVVDDDGDDDEDQANSESESASQSEEEFADDDMAMPESVGVERMPCLAHTLQLVLKAIDNVKSYSSVILKARKLVKTIRKSSVATQKLLEKCGLTLVTDCSTR